MFNVFVVAVVFALGFGAGRVKHISNVVAGIKAAFAKVFGKKAA